jgi:hypothetical protein
MTIRGLNWFLFPACLVVMGCAARTSEIAGEVTYHGQPLTRGTVTVFCQDGRIYASLIDQEGRYRITGVPAGTHRLGVRTHPVIPNGFARPQQLPPTKDAPQLLDPRAIKSPAERDAHVPIPERYSDPDQSGLSCTAARGQQTYDIHLTP